MPSVNVKPIEPRTSWITTSERDANKGGGNPMTSPHRLLQIALAVFGAAFLLNASRNPQAHRSLIWFTVWSSVVHGSIMAVQSMPAEHCAHLLGDVPALFLFAIVLGGLLVWSEKGQAKPLGPLVAL